MTVSTILQVAPVPDLRMEVRKSSHEDLFKSNTLKIRMRLTKQSSSKSEVKHIHIKLSSELQAALFHQQRVVEERDQLPAELQET